MKTQQLIIGHRGLSSKAPENTMAAFRAAVAAGVQWIETDVDILGDATPILCHDASLDRTTDASGYYFELSQPDLAQIDAGSWFDAKFTGERIPLLSELIELMNQTGLNANIEVKPNPFGKAATLRLVDAVISELERLKPGPQVIISSFNPLILALFRDRAAKLPRAALVTDYTLNEDWRTYLELLEAQYVHPESQGLTKARVSEIRSAGYGVNVWTVDDKARANELFNWGVTGVITNVPDQMLHLVRSKAL